MPCPKHPVLALLATLAVMCTLSSSAEAAPPPSEVIPLPPIEPRPQVLTLEEIEQLAIQANPTLPQAAADVRAAQGRALQAGLWPNPTLYYTGQQIGSAGRAGQHGFFVEQNIITGHKLALSRQVQTQAAQSAEWTARAQQLRVLNTVRIIYYRALGSRRLVDLEAQQIATTEKLVAFGEEMLRKKKIEESDEANTRIELILLRGRQADAKTRQAACWQQLLIYAGRPDLCVCNLADTFDAARFDYPATITDLLASSPELQQARSEACRAELALQRQEAGRIPDVNVQLGTQYDFSTNHQQASVEVGVPLPIFDRNQGGVLEAQANLARARAEVARTELILRQRFSQTCNRYQIAAADLKNYRDTILSRSQKLAEMRLEDVRSGKGAWSDVLDAHRSLQQRQRDYVQKVFAMRRAEVLLAGAILFGGLDQPSSTPGDPDEIDTIEDNG